MKQYLGCLIFARLVWRGMLWAVLVSGGVLWAQEPQPFQLDSMTVAPGQRVSGEIQVEAQASDNGTFIPVTVLHGSQSGPVLSLIAGIHGSEYAPILSLQQLPDLLDPIQLAGTIIIVHIANMPAFKGRTIYFGPDDLKNLNRSFPGKPDGSITERIADRLTQTVITASDYLIDIHSGDGNESLRPSYSAFYGEGGTEEVNRESRRLAVAFGLETVVVMGGNYSSTELGIYTSAQAVARGIPAMDIESGQLGSVDDRFVDPITVGVLNVLQELEMIMGEPLPSTNPLFITERARVYSEHDGIWYPDTLVSVGDYVKEDTRLGVITDYFGNQLKTVSAPASGVLLILFGTPPVNAGDNLAVIAKLPDETSN
ncbi:MAG: succinylglutamate desuccinylase/aspartoacylase family protein [Gammaproteobacteria bacterium]|nr:succinylglutamate desuccinylase/aspartoacylase family protein [Gammaproteobacteria bacterium]MCY4357797.1 succinylglutamate desuccinylase/aspartoacylase family protein [Gammaproteobacteria bacterium]